MDHPQLTDRTALIRARARAVAHPDGFADFLHRAAADDVQERLDMVNRTFTCPAVVSGFPELWASLMPEAKQVEDTEILDLQENSHDLIVHALALHWANDPVGQLVQVNRALKPDGLLLAVCFGGETLSELRSALAAAEVATTGGLSPRVAPMGEIRAVGALMQRAGFALPVADSVPLTVSYETPFHLMRDLRAMGETNSLASRHRAPASSRIFQKMAEEYAIADAGPDGRINATFELLFLTGWSPAETQPKPLRPGSATSRLADALGTNELRLNDPARSTDD